ncbi:pyridoxal phosphate-dependent aminotransferase family protein [Asanoa sp. NPDC049573]|uniref:aminotransferase class I/II-fold pyridoxal phosphate-dependent enzyme n=1 Tax=Asanoa sp. NPDC049573 TaxID=3155396 RepID=UPI003436F708
MLDRSPSEERLPPFTSIQLTGANNRWLVTTAGTLLNFSAPNYLGLADHPAVVSAAHEALNRFGSGPGAGPTVSGRSILHEELEQALSSHLGVDSAVVMPSGSAANHAVLAGLVQAGDVIISDALNHASIVDGCRLSPADVRVVPHRSVAAVRDALSSARAAGARRVLIVTDGVFSVDGDIADLASLASLRTDEDILIVVDDAHGLGVLGQGRGTAAYAGVDPNTVITTSSFSKALGGFGGAVTGPGWAIEQIRERGRSYIFSAALPPPLTAAASAALELAFTTPLIDKLWTNQRRFVALLASYGFAIRSPTPLLPLVLGDHAVTMQAARALLRAGVLAVPLGPPVTPADAARIRFVITAAHTDDDLATAADALDNAITRRNRILL